MSYLSEVLADNPKAYYRLGGSVVNGSAVTDSSSGGHHGVVANPGGALTSVAGLLVSDPADAAMNHGANINDCITIPDMVAMGFTAQALTIEFLWKGLTNAGSWNVFLRMLDAALNGGFQLTGAGVGLVRLYVGDGAVLTGNGPTLAQLAPLFDGNLHHVVITWDGATAIYKVDTVSKGSFPLVRTLAFATGRTCYIFADPAAASTDTRGTMDEVAIYNAVLSDARQLAHFNAMTATQKALAATLTGAGAVTAIATRVRALAATVSGIATAAFALTRTADPALVSVSDGLIGSLAISDLAIGSAVAADRAVGSVTMDDALVV